MRLGISKKRAGGKAAAVIFAAILLTLTSSCARRLHGAFVSAAHACANNAATTAVSESVREVFSRIDDSEYSKITASDRATLYSTDTARLNLINSRLAELIQKDVTEGAENTAYLPLGSVTGIAALAGSGPYVPVKIRPVSLVDTDFEETVESYGINQVRHSVSLKAEIKMAYSGYMFSETETVKVTVPIADTVIVGDVPEYYGASDAFVGSEVKSQ